MRLLNRLLAALLALGLVVGGILLIIEVIADFTENPPVAVDWVLAYRWAQHTSWNEGGVRVTCIAIAAVGLILLVAELKRPRVSRFRVKDDRDGAAPVDAAYTRRGVAGAVRTAVVDVDGIKSAKVAVTRRRVKVVAETRARDTAAARELHDPAADAVRQRLDELRLARPPKLKLTTTQRKR